MKNNEKPYDYLIVGAGLYGSVFAYRAQQAGKRCLVIDKRRQLGGNLCCENMAGINVHLYGAHIFHTSNAKVWQFVNRFVRFNNYINSPIANYKGKLFNLPFNMNTFQQMWGTVTPDEARRKIEEQRHEAVLQLKNQHPERVADGRYEPANLEEQALMLVGNDIYKHLIKGYTEKQWGRNCCELPSFIIKRLPVRLTFDNNYFNDLYQGIPVGGYNKLTEALLEGVETKTDADYFADRSHWQSIARKTVFTGPIDQFFDYRLGHLEYRSLLFEHNVMEEANHQGVAVMNYTDKETPFTRTIEHKHFEMFGQEVYNNNLTVLTHEYPQEWQPGMEPYYPINNERNNRMAEQYRQLAMQTPNVVFGGRLAEYRYYDMAPIVEKVLELEI